MLRGLTTITYTADDVNAARDWYATLLGQEAYFAQPAEDTPAYVEFRVGADGDELGIMDRRFAAAAVRDAAAGAGVTVYWAVDDVDATLARLAELGATPHEPRTERGPGFVTASMLDPFGNVLGVMENSHFDDLADRRATS
ncbi:VOC family protein [Luteimicrobium xylanilyticum]|uniref:Lactoylglutathione lyase n=1 Tax=Luteimicrobium xylanilyticum TaxID=1133546 RepID=A0A5P9Q9Y2_9MICO|nr:VOC family protein [Luteimicrobium xylanilyticum]QFU98261.1 Lactoylglutathione lyase [Luteimicrobium xylanilyticum]